MNSICSVIWCRASTLPDLRICVQRWTLFFEACEIPIYIAVDSQADLTAFNSSSVIFFESDNWNTEWESVVHQLLKAGYKNFVSVLDDFYLSEWSVSDFNAVINLAKLNRIDYLNLNCHPDQSACKDKEMSYLLDIVPPHSFYRSSLQVSYWNVLYFKKVLERSDNIWDFENISDKDIPHYCVKAKPIKYFHLIEKGRWNYNILRLPLEDLKTIVLRSKINFNYSQVVIYPKLLISNLVISAFGFDGLYRLKRILGMRK